jgi:non-heme Fe2+,alpha-ketoglutarate-dependent halogenase
MVMRQGQFIVFWSTLMHASLPNSSQKSMRLGYTGRYVPNQVRVYPFSDTLREYGGETSLERFACVQVAGEDDYHHNKIVNPMASASALHSVSGG